MIFIPILLFPKVSEDTPSILVIYIPPCLESGDNALFPTLVEDGVMRKLINQLEILLTS